MSIASKVKGLLSLTNHKTSDLSDCLGMSVQSVRNKFSRDSISVPDLIKICEYLDCELLIQTKGKQAVYFSMDDLKDARTKTEKGNNTDALILKAVLNPDVPPEGTKIITGDNIKNPSGD